MFQQSLAGKRIVLTTFGSFGDLHPYIAIALELKHRGHTPVIATTPYYREKIEREGINFHPVRPDIRPPEESEEMIERVLNVRTGGEFLFRQMILPGLREGYEDLSEVCQSADLLITHLLSFAGVLLAQKERLTWASSVLAPASFFSAYDPTVPYLAPVLYHVAALHPWVAKVGNSLGKRGVRSWVAEVDEFRRELGLPPGAHPMFEGQHSPQLVLALFSSLLGAPQPDWPAHTHTTGFPFYDRTGRMGEAAGVSDELNEFLDAGEPPVIFTLGSSAVWVGREFYRESVRAAIKLKRRAVLLIGDKRNLPADTLPEGIIAIDYAPYSELLPRASVVVHSGGVGTTAQTLRAGVPALVVPYSFDQPDNAARVARLGVARSITRKRYTAARVANELKELIDNLQYRTRAEETGRRVRSENGGQVASDLIEGLLKGKAAPRSEGKKEDSYYAARR